MCACVSVDVCEVEIWSRVEGVKFDFPFCWGYTLWAFPFPPIWLSLSFPTPSLLELVINLGTLCYVWWVNPTWYSIGLRYCSNTGIVMRMLIVRTIIVGSSTGRIGWGPLTDHKSTPGSKPVEVLFVKVNDINRDQTIRWEYCSFDRTHQQQTSTKHFPFAEQDSELEESIECCKRIVLGVAIKVSLAITSHWLCYKGKEYRTSLFSNSCHHKKII